MVRPRAKEPKHQFSVMLKPSVVDEIDTFAEKYNLTRSQLMANLMETGLDELRALDRIGIVPMVYHGTNILKKFKEALFNGKVSLDEKGEIEIKK
jgi:metal-responsive CopG/Arc/MetJ family transcriptional regulator